MNTQQSLTKGIVLAGGSGTRLYPLTQAVSKQLLPVYDKPMVYYPLSTLMLADIRDILVITTPQDQSLFHNVLKDGKQWGVNISYATQPAPNGLAEAFIIGKNFIGHDACCLILGDNIYYGHGLMEILINARNRHDHATIFGYRVKDPQRYGVAQFDSHGRVIRIIEKPKQPISNYAITGLYFYDNQVVDIASSLSPSARGELEITDVNNRYLERGQLTVEKLGRGIAWLDTGTHESLMQAANFIEAIEARQGLKVACPEEIAFKKNWIDATQVQRLAHQLKKNSYGDYLLQVLDDS